VDFIKEAIKASSTLAGSNAMVPVPSEEIDPKVIEEGKAIFSGIQFGFDEVDIKPESEFHLADLWLLPSSLSGFKSS
jgi:hypothetical protein